MVNRLGACVLDPVQLVKQLKIGLMHENRGPGGITGNVQRPIPKWPPRGFETVPLCADLGGGAGQGRGVKVEENERVVWEGPLFVRGDLDV